MYICTCILQEDIETKRIRFKRKEMILTVDLRADRELLNPDFEKYQFHSEIVPTKHEKKLEVDILRFEPSGHQSSLLEARLFAFHNHLFKNPYDSSCWFVDNNGAIWRYDVVDGSLDKIYVSESIESKASVYNPSICFASENIIVINTGNGALTFLELENTKSAKSLLLDQIDATVILDARYVEKSSKVIVALYKVDEDQGKKFSRLVFLFYNYETNVKDRSQTLKLVQKQTAKVKKAVENLYIDKTGNFFYAVTQNQIEFDFDSINPIKAGGDKPVDNKGLKIPRYCWSQEKDSITVYVKFPKKYVDVKPKVDVTPTSILISIGEMVLLHGQTPHRLESDLTTWKRNDDTLEVELSKYESGLIWSELITGNDEGEYLPNQELAAQIHSRLSHLCSDQIVSNIQDQPSIGFNSEQLEDCDVSGGKNLLLRCNFNTHSITHEITLDVNNHVIFSEKQVSGQALCLRYDHDGCVWMIEESENEDWNLKHVDTFPAFGYVEASKENKKFCVAPPDRSFIAIVEHLRNVFLYEKPEKDANIAKQRIVDIGNEVSPVIGAAAVDKSLIISTKNTLYQLQVYS